MPATSEIKEVRMDVRTTSKVKSVIKEAADLQGITLSAFIANNAYATATRIISEHRNLELSDAARDQFLSLLDAPPEPNEALKALLKSE